mgnify:CR=1 FL=1
MTRFIPIIDLAFLWIDRPETPSNVGVLMLFDPPGDASAATALSEVIREYRAAPPTPPFDCVPEIPALGLPRWRTVRDADLEYHVTHERLAAPGGMMELQHKVADLHRPPLDRSRPLFRLHLIDGLESGQFALYLKSHHASWDGRSAMARVFRSFRRDPGPATRPFFALPPATEAPAYSLPGDIAAGGIRSLFSQAMAVRELFTKLGAKAASRRRNTGGPMGNQPFGGPQTRFNLPVESERSFACFTLPLESMRRVARAFDGKINDVVLSIVDSAAHRYLADHGAAVREPLVAMVPVALREEGDEEATTKAASMFVPLGKPRSGAAVRMLDVIASTAAAKKEFDELSDEAKMDYSALAFGLWFGSHALGMDAFTRPVINLTISNVGGLPGPFYLGRSRLTGAFPVSMIADPVGLNVTMMSVDGKMDFGIVANRVAVPDPDRLAQHCLSAFARLEKAAQGRTRAPGKKNKAKSGPRKKRPSARPAAKTTAKAARKAGRRKTSQR